MNMDINIQKNQLLQEEIATTVLSSGLPCYIIPKKGFVEKQVIFATNYGSMDSKFKKNSESDFIEVPDGIAHFLEHKMFEKSDGNVFDAFSKVGASVNAYTNANTTAYYFTSSRDFDKNLALLLDFVQAPYFTEESVEKEKGIIGQEIKMYDDNADWRVYFNVLMSMYKEHPVNKNIAGSVESIQKINKDLLYTCYETFYHPKNMAVVCVGDLDIKNTFSQIEQHIKKYPDKQLVERSYGKEPATIQKEYIEEKLSVSQPIFQIGFKDAQVGFGGKALCKKDAVTKILLQMLVGPSSSLYQQLYEQGLIDDSFGAEYAGEVTFGHGMMGGNSKDPQKVRELLEKEIYKVRTKGLSWEDFERIRKKQLGRFIRTFNSIDAIANGQISLCFKDMQVFDYVDAYIQITISDLEERFRSFICENQKVLSVILPN